MALAKEDVRCRLYAAYESLVEHDQTLLELDVNERSITHKLAEYLQTRFPEWNVDCEYNRNREIPKRLTHIRDMVPADDTSGRTVFPDIIVHHRGKADNLLVIEAKKNSTSDGSADEEKLKAYLAEHNYQFAFTVVFPVGILASKANPEIDIAEVTL